MAVNLNACVPEILCGLSGATISLISGLIDGQIGLLTAQIAAIEAQILQYDILSLPIEAANSLAQGAINQARQMANLLPLALLADCVDLHEFNENVNGSIDNVLAELDDFTRDATRLLSIKEELNFTKNQILAVIDQFNAIKEVLAVC